MIRDTTSTGRERRHYTSNDFGHSPLLVFYEATQACDLACTGCRPAAQTRPHPNELNTKESRQLIDQLSDFPKRPMLVMTGGDPLKRADIYELIDYASDSAMAVSMALSATGVATPAALRRLRNAGVGRITIGLDGADPATHDGLRGVTGSYRRTLEILADARDLEMPIQVNTQVTPDNIEQIDVMAHMLAEQQILVWSLRFPVPVGNSATVKRLSAVQYEQIFEKLWFHEQRQPYRIKTSDAPHYHRYAIQHQHPASPGQRASRKTAPPIAFASLGLNDGKGMMFVGHTGLIHPSRFLPIVCGLFPLDHIVHVYQRSPIFRGLRDANRLEGKCRRCEFRHLCGGSRARAYALTGNIYAEEPDCAYQPAASQ